MQNNFGKKIGDIKQRVIGIFVKKETADNFDKNNFQKLTPVRDANLSIYKDALDYVFANNDIKNIGISGAYCAGKTSVIESYKKTCPERNFLHISLAYFESEDGKDTKDIDNDTDTTTGDHINVISENILEGKILNQLIHQINPSNIPQSNFKMKNPISKIGSFGVALSFILFCSAFLYMLRFESWKMYVESLTTEWLKNWLAWTTNNICLLFSFFILVFFATKMIYRIIQLQKNKNYFKKIKFQGNEIEIFEQSEDSYFDKYLNEVLYLFENANAEVIVFEDMDRYNTNQIFQRLREVNTLINNRRLKEKQKPLRFFYLLRDDIFISKDRTKFFDFIIPIVPILDGSNSYDQFIKHFRDGGLIELFDESFLKDISLYVDDMRILKNIYNEFIIYKSQIVTTEQDTNKLLAILVYKNLFPRDFSDLQMNKGFVSNLFKMKDTFVNESRVLLENKIEDIKNQINVISNEMLKSESEVEIVYSSPPNLDYYRNTKQELVPQRDARKLAIRQRGDGSIGILTGKLNKIEKELQSLKNKKLCEIINKENIDLIFQTEYKNEIGDVNKYYDIRRSDYFDLLKYLIRNGFIDETYSDYMTYFYENSISKNDKMFLRSVTDENAKDYSYTLNQPEKVASYLRIVDFDKEETLNFDLLSYLLQTRISNSEKLKRLSNQILNKRKFDFIVQYFDTGRELGRFINYTNQQCTFFFELIIEESNYTDRQKKDFALSSIYYTNDDDLIKMDTEGIFSVFIRNCADFLEIDNPKTEKIIKVFEFLKIKFVFINFSISNLNLWSVVYEKDMYEINVPNIESILENQYKCSKSDDFKHRNFSIIRSKPDEPLNLYVRENFEQYIVVMLANCEGQITDDEEAVTDILNDGSIREENKIRYIDYLQTTVVSLVSISETRWWEKLIKNRLLAYTEDNVLNYFFRRDNCFDSILIDYINGNGDRFNFDFNSINKTFGENNDLIFFNAVVECNELQNSKYEAMLNSLNRKLEIFEVKELDEEKLRILIEQKILCMTDDILQLIREHYSESVYYFIIVNIQDYIELVSDNGDIRNDEILEVLKSDVNDTDKFKLLELTNLPMSINDKNYSDKLEEYILNHNYQSSDMPYLLEQYDSLSDMVKISRMQFFEKHFEDIILNEYVCSYTLLKAFFSSGKIDIIKKLELLAVALDSLDKKQCIDCLKTMQCRDYLSLFDNKRPKFEINDLNERILNIYKNRGWITKFEVEHETGYFRAFGRKQSMFSSMRDELL